MARHKFGYTMNPFGSTEEYNARLEKRNNPNYKTRDNRRRSAATRNTDVWIESLYKERDRLNRLPENKDDPWEVDHIRPLSQGGEHRYENLRLLRASRNCDDQDRSEERIKLLLEIVRRERSNW